MLLTFDHGKDYEEAIEKYKLPYVPIRDYITKNFPKIKFSGRLRVVLVPYENICFIGRYSLKTSVNSIINNEKSAVQEASEQIKILTKYQNGEEGIDDMEATPDKIEESKKPKYFDQLGKEINEKGERVEDADVEEE